MTELAPEASPVPWGLWCVAASGVFSALVWGMSTLFRSRSPMAPPPDDPRP